MTSEKRPREYAAEIVDLPTKDARREALERVPEELRELTKEHVITIFNLRKWFKNK